ncbi:DUF2267 domain-containing protein [Spirillospora sp. NPDC048832]
MKHQELVSAVRDSTYIDCPEHAERAVQATLRVLGDRLAGGESADLASRLPPAITQALPEQGGAEPFTLEEFYRRVADHAGISDGRQARRHARAVLAALKASVTHRQFDHLVAQLPPAYDDLLGTQPIVHT